MNMVGQRVGSEETRKAKRVGSKVSREVRESRDVKRVWKRRE